MNANNAKTVEIHGVPMDLGANLRGVDMGPTALRIAGIDSALRRLGYTVIDHDEIDIKSRVALAADDTHAKYLDAIVKACDELRIVARRALDRGHIPIFLGGDHSLAAGTVAGTASYFHDRGEKMGLIWFDAHADMNTPDTSPTGNVHGMPLATLVGFGPKSLVDLGGFSPKIDPENVWVIGARDVDEKEKDVIRESGINVLSMKELDRVGMGACIRKAIEGASRDTAGIHLSFDIDGLDPSVAPGVGTPVRGGIDFREAHLFMEMIADSGKLVAMDVVELNPIRDIKNSTAEAVVHLIQSAFGKQIL